MTNFRFKTMTAGTLTLITACSPVTNSSYRTPPLATLRGQLVLPAGTSLTQDLRLAMAWAPGENWNPGYQHPSSSIFTEDISFEGSFPLNYSFDIHQPPPSYSLAEFWQGSLTAIGMLVAYRDLNGNERLDPIPWDGAPIDKVLGTSTGDLNQGTRYGYSGPTGFLVLYFASPPNPNIPIAGLRLGFNLVQNSESGLAVVDPSTPVPIDLTGSWKNDFIVCDPNLWDGPPHSKLIPWECGIVPPPEVLSVDGSIEVTSSGSVVELGVNQYLTFLAGSGRIENAVVTVNGRTIPWTEYSPGYFAYYLSDSSLLTLGGRNEIKVHAEGFQDASATIKELGDFQITAPTADSVVHWSGSLDVAWTPAPGSVETYLADIPVDIPNVWVADGPQPSSPLSLTFGPFTKYAPSYSGAARLRVLAYGNRLRNLDGWNVQPMVVRSVPLQFVP